MTTHKSQMRWCSYNKTQSVQKNKQKKTKKTLPTKNNVSGAQLLYSHPRCHWKIDGRIGVAKKILEQERVDQTAFKNNDLNLLKISNGCTKCIGKQLRGSNTWLWRGVRCNTQHDLQQITILLFAEWRHWESNGFEREMLILATKCFEQFPHRWAK